MPILTVKIAADTKNVLVEIAGEISRLSIGRGLSAPLDIHLWSDTQVPLPPLPRRTNLDIYLDEFGNVKEHNS